MNDALGYYLAGFTDGEGCFAIRPNGAGRSSYRCEYRVHLRADDRPLLDSLCEETGLGSVVPGRKVAATGDRKNQPSFQWVVTGLSSCCVLVDTFQRYPLRGKKAQHFAIWVAAIEAWKRQDHGEMHRLSLLLTASRAYSSEWEPELLEDPEPQLELA